jgi:hypothetical protein
MKEKPPEERNFRVIEGGKRELKGKGGSEEPSRRNENLALIRKLSASLDKYLTSRPADREERVILLDQIYHELWALPSGGANPRNAALRRTEAKLGKRPITGNYWRNPTDEEITWSEHYAMEHANAVGEKMMMEIKLQRKLQDLENHLSTKAARAYDEGGETPSSD